MNDLHWWSANDLAAAIRGREVSSREALEHLVERIERLDAPVNAVVSWDLDRARDAAGAADDALAAGDELGPLHGVPMTIKDSFETAGHTTTSGAREYAQHVPASDAWAVARLRAAGAIPFAKTNLPAYAGDVQTYNDVFGTTNNPHDPTRTSGGSSGGAAAALSMGFTPIELGSDIGGSIRVPAHDCGVMGHKPSFGIVPTHGHIPGPPGTLTQADLAVTGPMARSIGDLEVMLGLIAGPDRWNVGAWKIDLPPSRAESLDDLRIAAWLDDDHCRVDASTARVLANLVTSIEHAGGRVDTEARPAFALAEVDDVFRRLLFAALSGEVPREKVEHMAATTDDSPLGAAKRGMAVRHRDWLAAHEHRQQIRQRWADFFTQFDVMLMPVHPVAAIPHDHSMPMWNRSIAVDGQSRNYGDLFTWIAPAGAGLLPATVVPAGVDDDGLPIGIQIVGPYLDDRTTLQAGRLIARLAGGCPRPALAAG